RSRVGLDPARERAAVSRMALPLAGGTAAGENCRLRHHARQVWSSFACEPDLVCTSSAATRITFSSSPTIRPATLRSSASSVEYVPDFLTTLKKCLALRERGS